MNDKTNKPNESHAIKMINHLKKTVEILKEAIEKLKETRV